MPQLTLVFNGIELPYITEYVHFTLIQPQKKQWKIEN